MPRFLLWPRCVRHSLVAQWSGRAGHHSGLSFLNLGDATDGTGPARCEVDGADLRGRAGTAAVRNRVDGVRSRRSLGGVATLSSTAALLWAVGRTARSTTVGQRRSSGPRRTVGFGEKRHGGGPQATGAGDVSPARTRGLLHKPCTNQPPRFAPGRTTSDFALSRVRAPP